MEGNKIVGLMYFYCQFLLKKNCFAEYLYFLYFLVDILLFDL